MRGFSLIELLVALSIFFVVGLASMNIYNTSRQAGAVQHASYLYIDAVREAILRAKSMEFDGSWGVKLVGGNTIVFNGASYAARTTANDHNYGNSGSTTITGPTEIVFAKFTGIPNTSGTTTFINSFATSSVFVSATGYITY